MHAGINELKKTVFYGMLDLAGRVFIVVRYSDNVVIGNRGFTMEEIKNGLVLVFNQRMNFSWDDSGITASLVFGTSPQKCFIPVDDIVMIYSPELNSQFITTSQPSKDEPKDKGGPRRSGAPGTDHAKVVQFDFKKRKRDR
ncbi:MAG: hypothetical protein OHK0032_02000 [Thermodesulfovibrionales bacterium]